jgi:hypothetical protein
MDWLWALALVVVGNAALFGALLALVVAARRRREDRKP